MPRRHRYAAPHSPDRRSRRKARFFRWYRSIPIVAMILVALLSWGIGIAPKALLRKTIYPVSYEQEILASSSRHGVDPLLVCAVIKCESNWNSDAQSSADAVGLMQVLERTSEELALAGYVDSSIYDPFNLTDPATGIEYGCAYLGMLQSTLDSTDEVIAAYNAGPGNVEQWLTGSEEDISKVIEYPETALYLERVNRAYDRYRDLYDQSFNER